MQLAEESFTVISRAGIKEPRGVLNHISLPNRKEIQVTYELKRHYFLRDLENAQNINKHLRGNARKRPMAGRVFASVERRRKINN